jgi:hypothetical protein
MSWIHCAITAGVVGLLLTGGSKAGSVIMDRQAACKLVHTADKHIGETITFRGEYVTDHIERSLIEPVGCDQGIGLGATSADADQALNAADPPPWSNSRRIYATFTAVISQEKPNDFQFLADKGVRLDVARVVDVKVTGPQ